LDLDFKTFEFFTFFFIHMGVWDLLHLQGFHMSKDWDTVDVLGVWVINIIIMFRGFGFVTNSDVLGFGFVTFSYV
jgi:hypothetical protein